MEEDGVLYSQRNLRHFSGAAPKTMTNSRHNKRCYESSIDSEEQGFQRAALQVDNRDKSILISRLFRFHYYRRNRWGFS